MIEEKVEEKTERFILYYTVQYSIYKKSITKKIQNLKKAIKTNIFGTRK